MKPRCKPGDMAFLIGGRDAGKVVTVVRAYQARELIAGRYWVGPVGVVQWVIKSSGSNFAPAEATDGTYANTGEIRVQGDSELFPIRPGKGVDEVLRITGKPKTHKAKPSATKGVPA